MRDECAQTARPFGGRSGLIPGPTRIPQRETEKSRFVHTPADYSLIPAMKNLLRVLTGGGLRRVRGAYAVLTCARGEPLNPA